MRETEHHKTQVFNHNALTFLFLLLDDAGKNQIQVATVSNTSSKH